VSLGLSGPCSGRRAGPGGFVVWFRTNLQPREIKASRDVKEACLVTLDSLKGALKQVEECQGGRTTM
jgi:hypothetical protein